ncbi:CAP domain-containing protein [Lacinutrix sp. MEBiC02404]
MKKLVATTAILLSIFLMSCSAEEENNTATHNASEIIDIEYTSLDYEIAELINAHRISIGLQALHILNHASSEAISHNQYMVNQGVLSHDHFSERSQNLKDAVNAKHVSENVGYGYVSAQSLVNAWLNSEGHRQAIENPIYTDFGISSKKDAIGSAYVTNIFVTL